METTWLCVQHVDNATRGSLTSLSILEATKIGLLVNAIRSTSSHRARTLEQLGVPNSDVSASSIVEFYHPDTSTFFVLIFYVSSMQAKSLVLPLAMGLRVRNQRLRTDLTFPRPSPRASRENAHNRAFGTREPCQD